MMKSKKIKILTISILCILTITTGLSYGYYLLNKVQENNNIVGSKCFNLELASEENNINLNNMYPISDEEGKSLTPYTFTLKNTCDMTASYTLSMEMLEGTTLNSKYVDVMVNNGEIKLLTSYDEASTVLTGSTESRILDKGLLASNSSKDYSIRFWMDKDVEDIDSMNKTFQSKIIVDSTPINYDGQIVYDFDYTGGEQTFITPVSGTYKVELWGAGAGNDNTTLSFGSYTSGFIKLKLGMLMYVYVGENGFKTVTGKDNKSFRFNGGGYGNFVCYKYHSTTSIGPYGFNLVGGGATDIRIVSGEWNDFSSLKSRLMVAAGSGGINMRERYNSYGNGGGLYSEDGGYFGNEKYKATGATQTSPGSVNGKFGIGGYAIYGGDNCDINDGGGGGGGYYGGGGSSTGNNVYQASTGAGGSSFISGHNGCDAIKEESTENNIIHTGQSIHYSGLYFTNTLMIDGDGYRWTDKKEEQIGMPSHSNNSIIMGNPGNGYARITLVSIDE